MLNGSFGVGKSTVAQALVARLPAAMIFDPEMLGWSARKITEGVRTEAEESDDFQDIALWRALVVASARELCHHYQRSLVVPMTLSNPAYLEQIRGGFERIGQPLFHFCLAAPLATIQQRLLARGEEVGGWPWRKAEQCVPLLQGSFFETYVDAEQPVGAIVATILGVMRARL